MFAVGSEADANVIYSIASEPTYANVFLLSDYSVFLVKTFQREISEAICRDALPAEQPGQIENNRTDKFTSLTLKWEFFPKFRKILS